MLAFDDIWTAWQQTGTAAGYRIRLTPHGGNVRDHLAVIRDLVRDEAELRQALTLWWASPAISLHMRFLGTFAAHLTGVLAHLAAQAPQPFGVAAPPRAGVRGSKTQDNAASVAAALANFGDDW